MTTIKAREICALDLIKLDGNAGRPVAAARTEDGETTIFWDEFGRRKSVVPADTEVELIGEAG